MTSLNYNESVFLEQVRALEESTAADDSLALVATDDLDENTGSGFENRLIKRARSLVAAHGWQTNIDKPKHIHTAATVLAIVSATVLGMLATINALGESSANQPAINIYWLTLVLLGFPLLSLALWLIGCIGRVRGLVSGLVGQLPLLIGRTGRLFNSSPAPATGTWFQVHYTGIVGVWRISAMNHLLWLVYLSAGLVTLLLLLAVKQYDFYWGSTLLSAQSFAVLTETIGRPLVALGVSVPDGDLLRESRIGVEQAQSVAADMRRNWAVFLLSILFLYGILPRLLCYFLVVVVRRRYEANYRPDFYLPYYIHLRQHLQPDISPATIIDTDADGVSHFSSPETASDVELASPRYPPDSVMIGIELQPDLSAGVQINVQGRDDLQRAEQLLKQNKNSAMVLVADSRSLPDRGVQRRIETLMTQRPAAQRWFQIVCRKDSEVMSEIDSNSHSARLGEWYRAAQKAEVPVEQVQRINQLPSNNSGAV